MGVVNNGSSLGSRIGTDSSSASGVSVMSWSMNCPQVNTSELSPRGEGIDSSCAATRFDTARALRRQLPAISL